MIRVMLIGGDVSGTIIHVKTLLNSIKIAEPPNIATLAADTPVIGYKSNEVRYVLKQLVNGDFVYIREGLHYQKTVGLLLQELKTLRSQIKAKEGTLIGNF